MINATGEVEGDARFDHVRYVVNDFLDVTDKQVTKSDIQVLAAIDRAASLSNPETKIAVVATQKTILEMAELYQDVSEKCPYETQLFGSFEDARAWLAPLTSMPAQ